METGFDFGPSSRRSSRSGRVRALSFSLVSVSLLGVFSSLIPVADATHDPNDFFLVETTFPGVNFEDIHGTSSVNMWAVGRVGPSLATYKRSGSGWALNTVLTGISASPDSHEVLAVSATEVYVTVADAFSTLKNPVVRYDGSVWAKEGSVSTIFYDNLVTVGVAPVGRMHRATAIGKLPGGAPIVGGFGPLNPDEALIAQRSSVSMNWPNIQAERVSATGSTSSSSTSSCTRVTGSASNHAIFAGASQIHFLRLQSNEVFLGFITHNGDTCQETYRVATSNSAGVRRLDGSSQIDMWAVGVQPSGVGSQILRYDPIAGLWVETPSSFNALMDVSVISSVNAWAVGASGEIAHWDGAQWTEEPTPTGQTLNAVHCASSVDCWAVSSGGQILRLIVNPTVPLPSTSGFNWDPDDLFITASQAQCLGDGTSFTVNVEPPLLNPEDMDFYIINSDSNVVVEVLDESDFHSLGGFTYFYRDRTYPAGDYNALALVDQNLVVEDSFHGVAFNVPRNTCFGAEGILDAIGDLNTTLEVVVDTEFEEQMAEIASSIDAWFWLGLVVVAAYTARRFDWEGHRGFGVFLFAASLLWGVLVAFADKHPAFSTVAVVVGFVGILWAASTTPNSNRRKSSQG